MRGFCGYPIYGGQGSVGFVGWRFFQAYGLLEYRMNNLSAYEAQEVRGRVTEIMVLDAAVPGAGSNLDTDAASVWTHNKQEVRDRQQLLELRCKRLCQAVGVPPGPEFGCGNGVRLVV